MSSVNLDRRPIKNKDICESDNSHRKEGRTKPPEQPNTNNQHTNPPEIHKMSTKVIPIKHPMPVNQTCTKPIPQTYQYPLLSQRLNTGHSPKLNRPEIPLRHMFQLQLLKLFGFRMEVYAVDRPCDLIEADVIESLETCS